MVEKIDVFGVRLDNVSMGEALDIVEQFIRDQRPHLICTPNVDHIMTGLVDEEFREIMNQGDMTVPDGSGVVLFSRWNGTPLKEKVAGSDLLPQICEMSAREGYSIYLLGGREGVPQRAARNLQERYPGLCVKGTDSPPMNFEDDENTNAEVLRKVQQAKPDVLFLALGAPRQEKWLAKYKQQLGVPVMMGIGASIDFEAGEKKRAPLWIRRRNLEWLYRFVHEPRRLWRRVLLSIPLFLVMFFDLKTYSAQKRSLRVMLNLLKVIWVGFLILISYSFAVWIRHLQAPPSFFPPWTGFYGPYQSLLPFVLLSYLFSFSYYGLFSRSPLSKPRDILVRSLKAALAGTVLILLCSFFFKEIYKYQITGYSRISIGLTFFLNWALFYVWKMLGWWVSRKMSRKGLLLDRLLVIGTNELIGGVIDNLRSNPLSGMRAIGLLDDKIPLGETFHDVPVIGRIDEYRTVVRSRKVDEVLINVEPGDHGILEQIITDSENAHVRVSVLSNLPEHFLRGGLVSSLGGVSVISLNPKFR